MTASVIIPSYNGCKKLPTTLEALARQTVKDFESIVVVDGSTDETTMLLEGFKTKMGGLKVITQKNKGRSGARNAGAAHAQSELFIFIDDDIEVMQDNVERHVDFHKRGIGDVLIGKPVLDARKIFGDAFQEYKARREQDWNAKFKPGLNSVTFENYVFTTQNVSISKPDFITAGGFDERLTDSEDFDLSVKLLKNGRRLFYDTTLEVLHHDYADLRNTIRRQLQYYISKRKLITLHPDYPELMPDQFKWNESSFKDKLKLLLFEKLPVWESFFKAGLFKVLPYSIRDNLFSSYIYTKSVLQVRNRI
jgi:glycosyltransferase involved in cell wall biosynthesis